MAYKTVLVHVDSGRRAPARIELAFQLAAAQDAHVIGIHPEDAGILPVYYEMGAELVALQRRLAAEETGRARTLFEDAARRAGVAAEWRAVEGTALPVLTESGRYADVVIVGQDDPEQRPWRTPAELAADLVFAIGRPVLVVPYIGAGRQWGRRVLVAWNGGREAARAVADAMPLLRAAEAVVVLTMSSARDAGTKNPAEDLALWLARHGIHAEATHLAAGDGAPGDLLLSRAADLGADLIVMGAYGHTRMREQILGGVTRTLMRQMTVPVLMSH